MVLFRDLLYLAMSIASVFDILSVHDILNVLRRIHISSGSSLISMSLLSVQHLHPYKRADQIYALCMLIFGAYSVVSICKYGLHFAEFL